MKNSFAIISFIGFICLAEYALSSNYDSEGSFYGEEDLMRLSLSGCRPASLLNFNKYEVGIATAFADLVYKANSTNPHYAEIYSREVEAHSLDGYRFSTFSGVTGHTALTNYFTARSVLGFVAESDNEIVIAFRGSTSYADFATDSYVWTPYFQKVTFNGNAKGRAHVGFCLVFESCKDELTEKIMSLVSAGRKKLMIVGHSMGGALANLTAMYFAQLFKLKEIHEPEIKLLTYNAPRVGSKNFANKLQELIGLHNMIRFTVGTREGAATMMLGSFGFKHAGTNVVVPLGTMNKLLDHKMYHFLNGNAVRAFVLFNFEPKKANGLKSQLQLNKRLMISWVDTYQMMTRNQMSRQAAAITSSVWRYFGY